MRTKQDLKKEAFALDVSALPDYIDNKGEIVANLIAGAKTLGMLMPQTGIKAGSTERLNILSTNVTWSSGDCVATETGDNTVITPRDISTVRLTDRELLCLDELDAKLPMIQAAGARNEELPFANLYIEEKVKYNSYNLEKLTWLGSIATGVGNLALQDGFIEIALQETGNLAYEQSYGAGDFAGIASFSADPIGAIELLAANRTPELYERDDFTVFMNLANYSSLAKDIRDTYGLNATGDYTNSGMENATQTMVFPGTNIKIVGTHGLNGADDLFATYVENMRYGTDLENDKEDVELFFDKYHKQLVSDIVFSIGYQVQDPSQVMWVS
jgi:hypothetical protein